MKFTTFLFIMALSLFVNTNRRYSDRTYNRTNDSHHRSHHISKMNFLRGNGFDLDDEKSNLKEFETNNGSKRGGRSKKQNRYSRNQQVKNHNVPEFEIFETKDGKDEKFVKALEKHLAAEVKFDDNIQVIFQMY